MGYKSTYKLRYASRLCVNCGKPVVDGQHMRCHECRKQMGVYFRNMKIRRKNSGLCVKCGKPNKDIKHLECSRCRSKYAKLRMATYQRYKNRLKMQVFAAYGGAKCTCPGCNITLGSMLTIDHLHGGGGLHRKKIGGSTDKLYAWLIKYNFPSGFQVLCWNCNLSKHIRGKCEHLS